MWPSELYKDTILQLRNIQIKYTWCKIVAITIYTFGSSSPFFYLGRSNSVESGHRRQWDSGEVANAAFQTTLLLYEKSQWNRDTNFRSCMFFVFCFQGQHLQIVLIILFNSGYRYPIPHKAFSNFMVKTLNFCVHITKTCLHNFDPLNPNFM